MTKIGTSLEQSKKLIELGIDVNTADMCWCIRKLQWGEINETIIAYPMLPNQEKSGDFKFIPAWSLSALLELLPETICFEDNENDYAIEILIENGLYYLSYGNPLEHDVINVKPQACFFVDVCVDMIVKLHEKNLL